MMTSDDSEAKIDAIHGEKLRSSSSGISPVSCSICLDFVNDNGERSSAKLQCGHEFHLDCIGSAFNVKGVMQCPNCRKVERGQWLFANGSARAIPEIGMEDWIPNEDLHELSFSEMPFGVHWCPLSGLTVHSSFEEVESPPSTLITEHTAAPSSAHSYVAYFRPIPSTSSNSRVNVDDPNFHHRWNDQSRQNEIYLPHSFPSTDIQYQTWGCPFPPSSANRIRIDGGVQASVHRARLRSTTAESDAIARSGSFVHAFRYGQGPVSRARESSFISAVVHSGSHPGSGSHERVQVSHASHHQHQPSNIPGIPSSVNSGFTRFNVPRDWPLAMPPVPQSDHSGDFYIFPPGSSLHEAEISFQNNHFHSWERDQLSRFPIIPLNRGSGLGSFHHIIRGSDSRNRSGSFRRMQWS